MVTNLEERLNKIIERKSKATQLDTLIQGYRLYAQTEGKCSGEGFVARKAMLVSVLSRA